MTRRGLPCQSLCPTRPTTPRFVRRVVLAPTTTILPTTPSPSLAGNARRRGLPTTRSPRKADGGSSPSQPPPSPPSLKARDGGGPFSFQPPPTPSLARNARRKGLSLSNHTPIPLPRSKCKTGGMVQPSPFFLMRRGGLYFLVALNFYFST